MSKEHPQPPDPFGFTEKERLYDRISDRRFRTLLEDEATTIHKVGIDSNNYGEFLFVTLSRAAGSQRSVATFWGMGYHEYRERWITDHWRWYRSNPLPQTLEQQLTREEAAEQLQARQEEIAPYAARDTQTGRGRLYEMLADLTDEDGAISEIEELNDLWDELADDLE